MSFQNFLLNEDRHYLAQRVGDILTAMQNLQGEAPNLGNRVLLRVSQDIVNQIRRILHGKWDDSEKKYLKILQKVAVGLMNAVDQNDNIQETISSCMSELEDLTNKLGEPINSIASPPSSPAEEDEEEPLSPGSQIET